MSRRSTTGSPDFRRATAEHSCAGADVVFSAFPEQVVAFDHGATLTTRNVEDFLDTGVESVDPWRGP